MMDMEFFEPPTEGESVWSGEMDSEMRVEMRQSWTATHLPTGLVGWGPTRSEAVTMLQRLRAGVSPFGPLQPIEPVQVPNEGHPLFQGERPEPRQHGYPVC